MALGRGRTAAMRSGSMQGFSWVRNRGHARQNGYGKGVELEMVSWLCKQVSQSESDQVMAGIGTRKIATREPTRQRRGRLCWASEARGG